MRNLYEMKKRLCDELDEMAAKGNMSGGDLDTIHKLTDTIKNINKIEMLEESDYSHNSYGRYYGDKSNDRNGTYYVRGHYSHDGGYDNGNSRGMMADRIQEMLDGNISSDDRRVLQQAYDQLRR